MRRKRIIPSRQFFISQPLRSCLEWLAVRCSLECCGTDALKASAVMVEIWADSAGKQKTELALAQAREVLALISESTEPLWCEWLNYGERNAEHRKFFQQFLRELIAALEACAAKVGPS